MNTKSFISFFYSIDFSLLKKQKEMNTELNVNDLKIGDVVKIKHSRKGIFTIKVTSNNPDSEWLGA